MIDEITAQRARDYGSWATTLRLVKKKCRVFATQHLLKYQNNVSNTNY